MEQTMNSEKDYRVNFKQNAKGHWHAEFTVRAEVSEDLRFKLQKAKQLVLEELKWLNAKQKIEEEANSAKIKVG